MVSAIIFQSLLCSKLDQTTDDQARDWIVQLGMQKVTTLCPIRGLSLYRFISIPPDHNICWFIFSTSTNCNLLNSIISYSYICNFTDTVANLKNTQVY